jgi:predicted RND superfamily exporter protein
MLARLVARLEGALFAHRGKTLAALILLTVVMGVFAAQLRMSAGFDKQLPQDHEYIKTFYQYRDLVFGANRIVVVVHPVSYTI